VPCNDRLPLDLRQLVGPRTLGGVETRLEVLLVAVVDGGTLRIELREFRLEQSSDTTAVLGSSQ